MNKNIDNIEQFFKDGEQQLNQPAPTQIWDRLNDRLDDLPDYSDVKEDVSSSPLTGRTILFKRLGALAAGVAFLAFLGLAFFLNPLSPVTDNQTASVIPVLEDITDLAALSSTSTTSKRQRQIALLESYGYFDRAMVESPIQVAQLPDNSINENKDKRSNQKSIATINPNLEIVASTDEDIHLEEQLAKADIPASKPAVSYEEEVVEEEVDDAITNGKNNTPIDSDLSDQELKSDAALAGLAKDKSVSKKTEVSASGRAATNVPAAPAPSPIQVAPNAAPPQVNFSPEAESNIRVEPMQSGIRGDIRDEEALYPYSDLAPLQWMTGSWQGSTLNGQNIETWNWKNARTINGKAKLMSEGTERYAETMTFKSKRDKILLTFKDQKGQTIMTYKLIEQSARRIAFEKMGGSGPTDLVINRLGARRLEFVFSGLQDDFGTTFIKQRTIEKDGKLTRELSKAR